MSDLGTLGGPTSEASGINSSGQVVGDSRIAATVFSSHAFLYSGGAMADLGTLYESFGSSALAINDKGQVVGTSSIDSSGAQHAFLYSGGTMTDLGALGGPVAGASGINNIGQVVGYWLDANFSSHAFLYSAGIMADLSNLVSLPAGVSLVRAAAINELGQIAATGSDNHAYVLTPLPPVPAINSKPPNPTNQTSAGFTFSDTQSGVSFVCSLEGSSFAACTSGQSYTGLAQGSHTFSVEASDIYGNLSSPASFSWTIDTTPPLIGGIAAPSANSYGWNNTSVTVSFACSLSIALPGVDISSCSGPTTLSAQAAGQSVTGTALDNAGNTAQTRVTVNIDETNPVVTYTGGGMYTVDQTVNIACQATDALSGIAASTCGPDVVGPAYSFKLGATYNYSATATDKAGNVGSGSTSFTVMVGTALNVASIVPIFEPNPGVAAAMTGKLQDAYAAFAGGNANLGDNHLNAFINQVSAQSGKSLTMAQAAQLIQYATALIR
jgi:probable HAF family extracellular repeat protein